MSTDYWCREESHSRRAEEFALPIDEHVPYEARAAVPISYDTAESLIRWYTPGDDNGIWFGPLAPAIGWDLWRLHRRPAIVQQGRLWTDGNKSRQDSTS